MVLAGANNNPNNGPNNNPVFVIILGWELGLLSGCQVVCILRTGPDKNPTCQLVRESARVMFTTLSQTDCAFPQRLSPTHRPPGLVADDRTCALARKSGPTTFST